MKFTENQFGKGNLYFRHINILNYIALLNNLEPYK